MFFRRMELSGILVYWLSIMDKHTSILKMDLLISLYIFCIMVSELMGAKTVPLFSLFGMGFNGSVALLILPLTFSVNDIVTEVYGKERARSIIRSGLLMIFLLFAFTLIATSLPPSARFKPSEPAYRLIFGFSARMSFASLVAFFCSELLDVYVFVKMRAMFGKKRLWLRNNVSNFIGQFVDTAIFVVLAFYAFDKPFAANYSFIAGVVVPYWILKCSMSVIETPLVYLGIRWLKKS
jgi:queuosine precursor transporter